MKICGLQKLTLLDFPGYTACTVFTPGCNFRCPFCHNAGLVLRGGELEYSIEGFFEFLISRRGRLDGVCITGGEPLLQLGLEGFIRRIKSEGFKVKLDTNGSLPDKLNVLIKSGLLDYVAMDVKNAFCNYEVSAGAGVNIENVKKSVEILKKGIVPYEFRTTVVKELNSFENMQALARDIGDVPRYFLQQYKDSGDVIGGGEKFSAYSSEQMRKLCSIMQNCGVKNATLRGVD